LTIVLSGLSFESRRKVIPMLGVTPAATIVHGDVPKVHVPTTIIPGAFGLSAQPYADALHENRRGTVYFRRLAINGKYLGAGFTGVHRVADELVRQLARHPHELAELFPNQPCFIAPRNVPRNARNAFDIERRGVFRGQLWEQLDLPRLARSSLLLNLCNLAPMASSAAITMVHDAQVFITPASYSQGFASWYRHVLPVVGHRHARILTVSQFTATQLVRFGIAPSDHITIIPNGVDHILAHEARPAILDRLQLAGRKFVIALATVQAHKNIGVLLKAFSDPALSALRLVLIGGEDRSRFEAKADSVPRNVCFAGRIDDGELRALLESALCVAFPSTTEGFGLPPLEGMLLGCPAVMAPCGALPEVGADAALFAAADDPGEWVNVVSQLATDRSTWERYSAAGRQRASVFTWRRAGEALIAVIRSVVCSEKNRRSDVDAVAK
jgi:glycosyltransferase involved in cell wall biosynthesis